MPTQHRRKSEALVADFSEGSSDEEEEFEEVEEIVEEETEEDEEDDDDNTIAAGVVPRSGNNLVMPNTSASTFKPVVGIAPRQGPASPRENTELNQSAFAMSAYPDDNHDDDDEVIAIDDDDLNDDDDDNFLIIEESESSSSDEEFFSTEAAVRHRKDALDSAETYEEWFALPWRLKVLSFLEPTAVSVEMPPKRLNWARLYGAVQFAGALGHPIALCLVSIESVPSTVPQFIFYATTGLAAIDSVVRFIAGTKVVSQLIDIAIIVASVFVILDIFYATEIMVHVALVRGIRAFRITMLLEQFETFRDIYLVFKCVVDSLQSLFVFICIFFIGLFIFATGVYVIEIDYFDKQQGVWFRKCKAFAGCEVERSPFQSIPDALWLVMASMTTVGYGDVYPATTLARIVNGLAIIGGVFVIAFPTMILVGNLWITRKQYFKLEEFKLKLREEKMMLHRENERAAAGLQMAIMVDGALEGGDPERLLNATAPTISSLPALRTSLCEEEGVAAPTGISGFGGAMLVGDSAHAQLEHMARKATFAFMGQAAREVKLTKGLEYHYLPIMEVLVDSDGLPVVCAATERAHGFFTVAILLVVDCNEAREAAVDALGNKGVPTLARAAPVFGLEVTLAESPNSSSASSSGLRLLRRVDIGEVVDEAVPIHFVGTLPEGHTLASYLPRVRQDLQNISLRVVYSPQACSSGTWRRTFFVDVAMLKPTPFIQDLKLIAVHVAPSILMLQGLSSGASSGGGAGRPKINEAGRTLKNVAFVSRRHLAALFDPLFDVISEPNTTIRNRSQLLESLCETVVLHSREIRLHDIPAMLHSAVYALPELLPHEKLIEVDVDYFRLADWPFGVVMAEFSDKQPKLERAVKVGAGAGFAQPQIRNIESCSTRFEAEESRRKSVAIGASMMHEANSGIDGMRGGPGVFSQDPEEARLAAARPSGLEDSFSSHHLDPDDDDDWEL